MAPPYSRKRRWNNYVGDLDVRADRSRPESVEELRRAVTDAVAAGKRIRAVGSGHSASPVAKPDKGSVFVDLTRLMLPDDEKIADSPFYEWDWYASGVDSTPLRRVRAGMTIADLNDALAAEGCALANMGSYDGQTLAGVVSTATHGSGLQHRPLSDAVRAIELVVDRDHGGARRQQRVRVEPLGGPTDATKYNAHQAALPEEERVYLIPDDDLFYSCVVGLGCFGIAYAITIEVVPAFWLQERRWVRAWSAIAPELDQLVETHREFFDVTIFPHTLPLEVDPDIPAALRGEHLCLQTVRERPDVHGQPPGPRRKDPDSTWIHLAASILGMREVERNAARVLQYQKRLVQNFTKKARRSELSEGYKVHRTSLGDDVRATSAEMAVPLAKAGDAMREVLSAAGMAGIGGRFHSSPLGVRFVRASRHLLAPQYCESGEGGFCMIEAPLLVGDPTDKKDVEARTRLLRDFREAAAKHGGIPHWGQRNEHDPASVQRFFGARWTRWRDQVRRLSPYGTFTNEYARSLGV